jgi:hypothetical protein
VGRRCGVDERSEFVNITDSINEIVIFTRLKVIIDIRM